MYEKKNKSKVISVRIPAGLWKELVKRKINISLMVRDLIDREFRYEIGSSIPVNVNELKRKSK